MSALPDQHFKRTVCHRRNLRHKANVRVPLPRSQTCPSGNHPFPAIAPLADRAQKLPMGGWLNEGRLAVILQQKLPFRTR